MKTLSNIIKEALYSNLGIDKSIDAPSMNKLHFQASNQNTWINDPGGVMVTNFLKLVGRNTKKLENVYLYLKTKKDNLNYIAGCINNDKTYTGVKFYAISY